MVLSMLQLQAQLLAGLLPLAVGLQRLLQLQP
jgi:hypothetical protein